MKGLFSGTVKNLYKSLITHPLLLRANTKKTKTMVLSHETEYLEYTATMLSFLGLQSQIIAGDLEELCPLLKSE